MWQAHTMTTEAVTAAFVSVLRRVRWQRWITSQLASLYLNRLFSAAAEWRHFNKVHMYSTYYQCAGHNLRFVVGTRVQMAPLWVEMKSILMNIWEITAREQSTIYICYRPHCYMWLSVTRPQEVITAIFSVLTRQPRGWTSHGLDRRRGKMPETNWPKNGNETINITINTLNT